MESSARIRTALLTAVGVVAAVVLVAIAAGGSTSTGDGSTRKPSDALTDVLFSLYLIALVGGVVAFVYLLVLQRHARVQTGKTPRKSVVEMLLSMFVLVIAGALIARRLANWERPKPVEPEEAIGQAQTIPVDTSAQVGSSSEANVSWLPVIVTVGLVVLAVAAWWFAGRARRRARGELRPVLAAAMAQAVDESLDDLRAEPDPRKAVIATYARLERVLAGHGLPRDPAEAPLEYLGRMLAQLSVSDRAARALTDLFEEAKFSQHAVGPEMKEQAIEALETVRDDLLAAEALAAQEREAAIRAQRGQARAAQ